MTGLPSELEHDTILEAMVAIITDIAEDNCPEIKVIEVPVVKTMVFQFNKPIKLEFS